MTPTKPPTRAEALEDKLDELRAKYKTLENFSRGKCEELDEARREIAQLKLASVRQKKAALATDAPIVEGLDEALDRNERAMYAQGNVYGDDPTAAIIRDWKTITDAAKAYAQGRTQAVAEGEE